MTPDLHALVAAAPGSLVLPEGERRATVDVPDPLRLLDFSDLGSGRHVAVVEDASGDRWTVPLVVSGDGVRRAVPGDGVAEAVVRRLDDARRRDDDGAAAGLAGTVALTADGAFSVQAWWSDDAHGERGITVDQTNESVVVGERAMVKWAVRLPSAGVRGSQPAASRLAALSAAGFTETPRPWGLLQWTDIDGPVGVLLASVTEFLPGALDGWDWMVDDVRRAARGETPLDDALAASKRLGALTARMHVALATTGVDRADAATVTRWQRRALDDLEQAVLAVTGAEGERLQARARRIAAAYDGFERAVGTPLIDVHGDYHVGQVLRHAHDDAALHYPHVDPALHHAFAVTDFDGNPVLAPDERSTRQPAALDVAGMLASLDHVGRVVIRRTDDVDVRVVLAWIEAAQEGFRYEYVDTLARVRHAHLFDERLLAPLRLAQEVREYLYAVAHLPHWVYVPDAALDALLPDRYH